MRRAPRGIGRMAAPSLLDALLGCGLAGLGELEVVLSHFPGSTPAVAVALPLMTLPLGWRRLAPVTAAAIVYGAYAGQALAGGYAEHGIAVSVALLVAIYSLAAHAADGRVVIAALAVGQGVAWLALAVEGGRGIGDYLFSVLLGGGAWLGGYAVRSGRLVATRLEQRAEHVEAMSAAEREQALADERARIAREMHDVVAHTMSVVVVQTGAARQLLRSRPERSEELLLSAEATSREALSEMRRLLGLIRSDTEDFDVAPQPGLGQIDELVTRARESGLDLSIERSGPARPLLAGVDLAAYRIVQEGITNAIKHGVSPAHLWLRYLGNELEIELANAVPAQPRDSAGSKHGLIGMRERTVLYGGTLSLGKDGNTFTVRVRLPLGGGLE